MREKTVIDNLLINLATDFYKHPFGRYRNQGPYSGEKFREEILVPALEKHKAVTVDITYARGLGSSFLDEAFAGLIRNHGFTSELFKERVFIKSDVVRSWPESIWRYVLIAENQKNNKVPRK